MLGLLNKTWRVLLVPLFALAFFLGAYFYFYRGGYEAPSTALPPFEAVTRPSSSFSGFDEVPPIRSGLLVVDAAHSNDFTRGEVATLLSRVADRGYDVEVADRLPRPGMLDDTLRRADSFAVIVPAQSYSSDEVDLLERFVEKGGKLLLMADPTRRHDINSVAKRFGITFQPDYLYNVVEHDLNFQDIFVRRFLPDEITSGLGQIALYTAGSIKTTGVGLGLTDGSTRSSIVERPETFYTLAKGSDPNVLAVSDLTFLIPPQSSIMDNDRLISNIADFLTVSDKRFELADFPYFFKSDVDILVGRASLFDLATSLKAMLLTDRIGSEIRGVEDFARDTVFLGLYEDSASVVQYLDVAGIEVDDAVRTPFTPDVTRDGTAIILLHKAQGRNVLVILADSRGSLSDMLDRLTSATFRNGLVSESVGVYRSR